MRITELPVALLAGLLLLGSALAIEPETTLLGPAPVQRVIDGDTIEILLYGILEDIRLIGIDTPETVHPTIGQEPFGAEASAFMKSVLEGADVWLEFGVQERDQFGRVLAYVYLPHPEGNWTQAGQRFFQVNLEIARAGLADVLTISPNVRYAELYMSAVGEARAAGRGMWDCTPPPPPAPAPVGGLRFDPDRDCGDFRTHAEAQALFVSAGGPSRDPHRLHGDTAGCVLSDCVAC